MKRDSTRRRRWFSWFMAGLALLCVGLALVPLLSILWDAAVQGAPSLNAGFFTKLSPPPCNPQVGAPCVSGGIGNAIEDSLIIVGVAALIAVPIGLLTGIYLSEYGAHRWGRLIRFFVDVMTGIPSIVVGIVTYVLFLYAASIGWIPTTHLFNAFAGSVALAILMIPIVARTSDEALRLIPTATREAALALGLPRYKVILRIVLSSGRAAVITGVLLGVARAAGETAPLIMTIGGSSLYFQGLDQQATAIPLLIYFYGLSGYPNYISIAWGAALVLVLIMLAISIAARLAFRVASTRGSG
jgi:phosphate transport system permease protein